MSLIDEVREAGIIGAGGAGFPTHVKLAAKADYILLNGAECEPLLRVDQQLMAIYPKEVIEGFKAAGKAVGASKAIIGIKEKHKEVITKLKSTLDELREDNYIEVKPLRDIYPAGDEQVLVYELTGRIVPELGIPIQVGCVVINVETALNIYYAQQGKPVTETYITLAGDIPKRMTIKVKVGTPIMDVLRLSGIDSFEDYAIIDGGPMMGPVMPIGRLRNGAVTKKDKGYVVLWKDHELIRKKSVTPERAKLVNRASCEQCRMCTDLCPRFLIGHNLQPHKIIRELNYSLDDIGNNGSAQLCCGCNLCELFACPAGIFPKTSNNISKTRCAELGIKYQPQKEPLHARDNREDRLVPSKRLIARLGLYELDKPAPMSDITIEPDTIYVALKQHVGAPAVPIVKQGDKVNEGQMIGTIPENALGATIHSSITGNVIEINDDFIVIRRDSIG